MFGQLKYAIGAIVILTSLLISLSSHAAELFSPQDHWENSVSKIKMAKSAKDQFDLITSSEKKFSTEVNKLHDLVLKEPKNELAKKRWEIGLDLSQQFVVLKLLKIQGNKFSGESCESADQTLVSLNNFNPKIAVVTLDKESEKTKALLGLLCGTKK